MVESHDILSKGKPRGSPQNLNKERHKKKNLRHRVAESRDKQRRASMGEIEGWAG